jgi:predicted nucleic acid-binding protein
VNIEIKSKTDICRDLKDNYLISLAVDSNADFLITGDNDLLVLHKVENTSMINFNDFEKTMIAQKNQAD